MTDAPKEGQSVSQPVVRFLQPRAIRLDSRHSAAHCSTPAKRRDTMRTRAGTGVQIATRSAMGGAAPRRCGHSSQLAAAALSAATPLHCALLLSRRRCPCSDWCCGPLSGWAEHR